MFSIGSIRWNLRYFRQISVIGLLCIAAGGMNAHASAVLQAPASADKLFNDEKYDEARKAYLTAIKAQPKNTTLRLGLLRTLLANDAWKEGIQQSKEAEAGFPTVSDFRGFESLFLMRGGKPDEAIAASTKNMAATGSGASYWSLVAEGRCLAWKYDFSGSRKVLRHAIEIQPGYEEAYEFLLMTYDRRNPVESEKLTAALKALIRKNHPPKPTTDLAEIDKRKANEQKDKTNNVDRAKYAELFVQKPPYVNIGPVTEEATLAADSGQAAPVSFSFPFERGEGEAGQHDIIIPAIIDGVKVKLLLDTGAGESLSIGKYAAAKIGLPTIAKGAVQGVNGMETTRLHRAERLTLGKQSFGSIPVESIDNAIGRSEDGLIGGAVFDQYVVTVDFKDDMMTLTRGKNATAPAALKGNRVVQVPFHNANGYIYVLISIDNHKWWTILDTGAEGYGVLSLDLARMLAKEREKDSSIELTVKGRVGIGISETSYTVLAFEFPIDVGCIVGERTPYFIQMDTLYGASIIDKVSKVSQYDLAGLLGIGYLGQRCRRFSIDYPHHLLTMEYPDE